MLLGIVGGFGLLLVVLGIRTALQEYTATRWPRTQGVIQTAAIRVVRTSRGSISIPEISYSYQVNGQPYGSNRVTFRFGTVLLLPPSAESVVDAYPEGTVVTVYYNPRNPSEAVLEPGRYLQNVGGVAVGLFVLLTCARMYKVDVGANAGRLTSG